MRLRYYQDMKKRCILHTGHTGQHLFVDSKATRLQGDCLANARAIGQLRRHLKRTDLRSAGFSERCAPGTEFVIVADRTMEVK